MFSFEIGNTTVHLLPLLIFAFIILPAIALITAFVKTKQINSMKRLCQSGDYGGSIALGNKLIKYFTRGYKIYRVKRTKLSIEAFHVWLAISYLGSAKYDMFWDHINKVEQQQNLKYCWICTYYILQKDIEQVKHYKEKIEPTEEMKDTLKLLSGIVMCEEGKADEGKAILSEILPKLNFELTKQIVLNYTA